MPGLRRLKQEKLEFKVKVNLSYGASSSYLDFIWNLGLGKGQRERGERGRETKGEEERREYENSNTCYVSYLFGHEKTHRF